jgi:hypothetical protein
MKVVSKKPQMAPVVSRLGENPLFMSDTSGWNEQRQLEDRHGREPFWV